MLIEISNNVKIVKPRYKIDSVQKRNCKIFFNLGE